MKITFDATHGVWVAMGVYRGIPYLAEGATPGDAYNAAVTCAAERHSERVEI